MAAAMRGQNLAALGRSGSGVSPLSRTHGIARFTPDQVAEAETE
eukprot:CAMPEP_0204560470 /NCGR_PEP_ID=MMETSP0661-20131031/32640_1 /ASSEMBLY_ACC=CAM_ASM_000606 /TAXON_ID=109239 /ORGANISM="Alexandrium margalefi, Strain AMGDE01CS-322" /LENGTH=43 /DNA_ID= /DNA_START= /DNA_END= /DNA_ORIENTATION=